MRATKRGSTRRFSDSFSSSCLAVVFPMYILCLSVIYRSVPFTISFSRHPTLSCHFLSLSFSFHFSRRKSARTVMSLGDFRVLISYFVSMLKLYFAWNSERRVSFSNSLRICQFHLSARANAYFTTRKFSMRFPRRITYAYTYYTAPFIFCFYDLPIRSPPSCLR